MKIKLKLKPKEYIIAVTSILEKEWKNIKLYRN
jgi:hypothetical protein